MPKARHHDAQRSWHPDELAFGLDGVDDNVGHLVRRHGKGYLVEASRHLRLDETWPYHEHAYAVVAQRLTQAQEEPVQARLVEP